MRVLSLFLSVLSVGGALAAKKSVKADRFSHFHDKSLATSSPVKLDDASYQKLTSTPRDYASAILLTAMDARFACQLCREFQPEWDLLSKSWLKGDKKGESRLNFATLDFTDGRDTFLKVRQSVETISS